MTRIVILGAGGHGQVVADVLLRVHGQDASIQPVGYLDDNPALHGQRLLGLPVLGALSGLGGIAHDAVIVAIGDNVTRRQVFLALKSQGEQFAVAQHPSAVIAPDATIGPGAMICAGVVVNPGSTLGANVILNTGSTVDHHNQVGDHAHIAPGAHLGGEVVVGEGVLVGIGATVMPRCELGEWSIVGAGACVTRSVQPGLVVVGVPARPLQCA